MTGRTTSWVQYQKDGKSSSITARDRVHINGISKGPGWLGLRLEVGSSVNGWDGDDLTVDGHFIAMNCDNKALDCRIRNEDESGWIKVRRDVGAFRIHPEGRPFSIQLKGRAKFATAIIDGRYLDSVLGHHYELKEKYNVVDRVLEHVFRALIEELHTPSAVAVREALVRSFVLALASHHGEPAESIANKKGLSADQIESLVNWIERHLGEVITVKAMAARVDLSVAHFSQEFKRALGVTPWNFVVEKRLQLAKILLSQQTSVTRTAMECGLFDQAHLSRLFKQRLGMSPSAYAKYSQDGDASSILAKSLEPTHMV